MITENISTLKINKLTKAQYERELAAGNIDENALYLTPDEAVTPESIGAAPAANGQYAITTAGTGSAYTATVPGVTALTKGVSFIMIPNVVSASVSPTLNVNGLGAKTLQRRLSNMGTSVQDGYDETWLAAGLPFRVTYDGTYWIVEGQTKPALADLYGLTIETRELSYLEGATSNIQAQLDDKMDLTSDQTATGVKTFTNGIEIGDEGVQLTYDASEGAFKILFLSESIESDETETTTE